MRLVGGRWDGVMAQLQGFRSWSGLQRFVPTFCAVRNHFVSPRSLRSALSTHLRGLRAMVGWKSVTATARKTTPVDQAASNQSLCDNAPRLHPHPREGRSAVGAVEPLALTRPPSGGSKFEGPRQRPLLPLRAVHIVKPPALRGDTYMLPLGTVSKLRPCESIS